MDFRFHVHIDIDYAFNEYKIPLTMYNKGDVYIMQEDRIVWVGNPKNAELWMFNNEGRLCNQIYTK